MMKQFFFGSDLLCNFHGKKVAKEDLPGGLHKNP